MKSEIEKQDDLQHVSDQISVVKFDEPKVEDSVATPIKSMRRWIYIIAAVLMLVTATIAYYLSVPKPGSVNTQIDGENKSYIKTITDRAKTILPGSDTPPKPDPEPSIAPSVQGSVEDILGQGEYKERQLDFQNNDGPAVDKNNLKITIPGKQSMTLINHVLAGEMQSLYPIYIQNPNQEVIDTIATKLGLVAKATRPESNKQYLLEYKDSNAKLVYDPSGGTLAYESVPGVGDLPSFAKAEELARDLMASLGIPIESRQIKVISTQLSSIYENFASLHPTIAVHFLSQREESPILFSDVDHVRYGTEGNSLSPEITVEITGGNKITRLFHTSYAQRLGSTPVTMIDRTLDQAIEELKVYGGHIRSITEQGEQRSYFACADSKCNVYDATITKAYKGYAWNNSVGSLLYTEINDTTPRAFEYLLPVWIFEGTGKMGKSKTDESGKLIPNPDKSDNSQYYVETVKFVSTIPAFSKGSDANILEVKNYTLTIADSGKAKVSFETKYIFPTFKDSSFSYATPRNGIKYRLLVLFPDKTYSVINGYKQEVYPGEITFDIGDTKGEITTYLELSDFSSSIEKRTLTIN